MHSHPRSLRLLVAAALACMANRGKCEGTGVGRKLLTALAGLTPGKEPPLDAEDE